MKTITKKILLIVEKKHGSEKVDTFAFSNYFLLYSQH